MLNGTHQTELDALFIACDACQEGTDGIVVPRTAETITQFVAEGSDAWQATDIGFHG